MKDKLLITFSGGRTSAYMTWWLFNEWKDRENWDKLVVFANTGKESEGTLFFVDECANEWNIDIKWIEGYPSEIGKGWSVNHKLVSYETASRNGEPFEAMIKKLGIPFQSAPFCSPQLKTAPIKNYLKSIGWTKYYTAIGIRYDEQKRINKNYKKQRIIYPLIEFNPVTKNQIKQWWDLQSFDLDIHPDDGNCVGCWKKSFNVLARIMERSPNSFDWWQKMIDEYGTSKHKSYIGDTQSFYRGNKSINDIKEMAKLSQAELKQITLFEPLDGCSESCEAF
jgi:3'-phosphoadenosine 5'-phosphosulfate sulfotransferase (PAPS reductase)/FAD synthetase